MCGLYGYITHKDIVLTKEQETKRTNTLIGLGLAMQNRGTDASGIVGVTGNKHEIVKQNTTFKQLVGTKPFQDLMDTNPQIVIGHTRYATIGAKTDRNAHPFQYGTIVGSHNGSVSNWYEHKQDDTEVDSEAIFIQLQKHNNNYKEALPTLRGMFAITWLDLKNPDILHVVRDGNPLHIVNVRDIKTYFWASTFYELQSVVASSFGYKNLDIWSPKEEYVYEIGTDFTINKTKVSFKTYQSENTVATHTCASPKYCAYKNEDGSLMEDDEEDEGTITRLIGNRIVTEAVAEEKDEEIDDEDMAISLLSTQELVTIKNQVMSDGCGYCTMPVDIKKEGGVWYNFSLQSVMCVKCLDELDDEPNNTVWITTDDYFDMILELADRMAHETSGEKEELRQLTEGGGE